MLPQNWKYLLFLTFTLLLFLLVESSAPKKVDWTASYTQSDKRPYGTYLVRKLLPELFPEASIRNSYQTVYQQLLYEHAPQGVYIFINNVFEPTETDVEAIFDFVEAGGQVFIAAESFSADLRERWGIGMDFRFETPQAPDSSALNLSAPLLKAQKHYLYKKNSANTYFAVLDSSRSSVLGTNQYQEATFIRIGHGAGAFFLNSNPLAFTNYNLLARNNAEYIAKCFSYLLVEELTWDEFYKVGKGYQEQRGLFGVIQSFEPLRWALWLGFASLFLYVLFFTKRRQRIIPILPAYENTSVEFAETMGRMYYQEKNNQALALKILHNLQLFVKKQYLMTLHWTDADEDTIRLLAEKSNLPQEDIASLVRTAKDLQTNRSFSDEKLLKLYQLSHRFTQKPN
jgi:hypothetical protein